MIHTLPCGRIVTAAALLMLAAAPGLSSSLKHCREVLNASEWLQHNSAGHGPDPQDRSDWDEPFVVRNLLSADHIKLFDVQNVLESLPPTARVKVGQPIDILYGRGEGPTNVLLKDYLELLNDPDTNQQPFWTNLTAHQSSPSCPHPHWHKPYQQDAMPYVFDRGEFFNSADGAPLARHLLLPNVLAPVLPFVHGPFSLQSFQRHAASAVAAVNSSALWLPLATLQRLGYSPYLILGGRNTGVPFHRHADSLLAVFQGSKSWVMFPPDTLPEPRHIRSDAQDSFQGTNLSPEQLRQFARHAKTAKMFSHEPLLCEQRKGDVAFVPEGWFHAVANQASPTLAVALQAEQPRRRDLALMQLTSQLYSKPNDRLNALKVAGETVQSYPECLSCRAKHIGLLMDEIYDAEPSQDSRVKVDAAFASFDADFPWDLNGVGDERVGVLKCQWRSAVQSADALRTCAQVAKAFPWHPLPFMELGNLLAALGQPSSAIDMLVKSLRLDSTQGLGWLQLANVLMAEGDTLSVDLDDDFSGNNLDRALDW